MAATPPSRRRSRRRRTATPSSIAGGTYTEALTLAGKAITLREAAGADVILQAPAGTNAITLSGNFDGGNVSILGLEIRGVQASAEPGHGRLRDGRCQYRHAHAGWRDDPQCRAPMACSSTATTTWATARLRCGNIVITNSTFLNNGYNGASGSAHIKLGGFAGDALIQNVDLQGSPTGTIADPASGIRHRADGRSQQHIVGAAGSRSAPSPSTT